MNSSEALALFREVASDKEEPYLWSDVELYRYMDDAQKMFCRLTGGLGDASSIVTSVPFAEDADWVTLNPLILKFRSASLASSGHNIEILNMEDARDRGWRYTATPGRVRALVLGLEPGRGRLYSRAREADVINLVVDRLPLLTILPTGDQEFEIAEQHHQALITWMCYRAYSKQDAETLDRKKAADSKFTFEQYCFEATAEKERALSKIRIVRYGGYDGYCGYGGY